MSSVVSSSIIKAFQAALMNIHERQDVKTTVFGEDAAIILTFCYAFIMRYMLSSHRKLSRVFSSLETPRHHTSSQTKYVSNFFNKICEQLHHHILHLSFLCDISLSLISIFFLLFSNE